MKRIILTGMLIVSVLSSQGCILLAGAAIGGGGAAYAMGKLKHNFDDEVETVHKAALEALDKLDMYVRSENILLNGSKIEAETVDQKKVSIKIEALTEKASKIEIRVGLFGNESRSFMILGAIQKQL